MDPMRVVHYVILVLSAGVMLCGGMIMSGLLVPATMVMADHYRIILGLVVLLYGLHRFVVTFNRPRHP